jgi:hypothetical protein
MGLMSKHLQRALSLVGVFLHAKLRGLNAGQCLTLLECAHPACWPGQPWLADAGHSLQGVLLASMHFCRKRTSQHKWAYFNQRWYSTHGGVSLPHWKRCPASRVPCWPSLFTGSPVILLVHLSSYTNLLQFGDTCMLWLATSSASAGL